MMISCRSPLDVPARTGILGAGFRVATRWCIRNAHDVRFPTGPSRLQRETGTDPPSPEVTSTGQLSGKRLPTGDQLYVLPLKPDLGRSGSSARNNRARLQQLPPLALSPDTHRPRSRQKRTWQGHFLGRQLFVWQDGFWPRHRDASIEMRGSAGSGRAIAP